MAMFNFQLDGEKERKPMRSYIDIDSSGNPRARIYADEYDAVKSNPDFEPFLAGAGQNMKTAQNYVADEMNEERLASVERRIASKRREAVSAEVKEREETAKGNVRFGPDILPFPKTYKEKATQKQEELRALLEEQAGYMGETPELSAPMQQEEPATQAAQPVGDEFINLVDPQGGVRMIKKSSWNQPSKTNPVKKVSQVYLESGYKIAP
jgi:hypothetical protein